MTRERLALVQTANACRNEITRLRALAAQGPCDHPTTVSANDWCNPDWLSRWLRSQPGMITAAIEHQEQILERVNRALTTQRRKT